MFKSKKSKDKSKSKESIRKKSLKTQSPVSKKSSVESLRRHNLVTVCENKNQLLTATANTERGNNHLIKSNKDNLKTSKSASQEKLASSSRGKHGRKLPFNFFHTTRKARTMKLPIDEVSESKKTGQTVNSWYHGAIIREDIERILKEDGDFLLRKSDVNGEVRYAVSVFNNGKVRSVLLHNKDNSWWIRNVKKPTISDLLFTHLNDKLAITSDGTLIRRGIPRPNYYILHEYVEMKEKISNGSFGEIHKGTCKLSGISEPIVVAFRKLKSPIKKPYREYLIVEAEKMQNLIHKNIVQNYGVAVQQEPVLLVMEFVPGYNLRKHIKKNKKITEQELNKYIQDAARGMCYLSLHSIVHRDLCARNCLIGANDELKIADYNLIFSDKPLKPETLDKMIKLKWLSPETLTNGTFSIKSDVWSFGVLIYEIFNRCQNDPFSKMKESEAKKRILSGEQPLETPINTPPFAAIVMRLCFVNNPEERPDFVTIFKLLAPFEDPPGVN